MAVVFSNNATTALASSVTSSATSITVQDGSVFPTLSGSDYTYITLEDLAGNVEIVKLTARSVNVLTIVRAQDGTSARAFGIGSKCELRLTAALLNEVAAQADTDTNTTYTAGSGLALTGTVFSNTSPDRTVALTGAGATSISGTYPNFTITSTDTNTVYTHPSSHPISFITGLQAALDGKVDDSQVLTNVPAGALFTDTVYTLPFADNSANWNTAYTYSQVGHLPLAGGTLTGGLTAPNIGVTNIVTNKVVKFNGTILDDSNITDTGSVITLGTSTNITGSLVSSVDITAGGYLQATSYLYTRNDLRVLNAAGTGWTTWGTRSNGNYNLNVGTITATGGNSTNWNTAYGWGNHASQSYATQSYVGTAISNLVDSSPATLDTLNELAAALGDDPNFATTVSTSIGTKWTQDNAKISNWDTAYSWGNHASAGYVVGNTSNAINLTITGVMQANNGYKVGTSTVIDSSREATFATRVQVGGIDSGGNNAPLANNAVLSGYGLVGNRGTFYITNSGVVQIGTGAIHNGSPAFTAAQTYVDVGASRDFRMNGTTVIDSSRNLTNIGTISSGAITATGNSIVLGVGSTGNAFQVFRGSDGAGAFRVMNTGEVIVSSNYLYVDASQGSYFSSSVRFRGTISNDTGTDVTIGDTLNVTQGIKLNGTTVIDSSRNLTNIESISSSTIHNTGILWLGSTATANDQFAVNNGTDIFIGTSAKGLRTYADLHTNSGNNKYWHSGNDGSGSGLDADLLDGQHGSYYATAASVSAIAALDPVITLTGAVTGSGTMTNLGNVSIATTATADPTLTLTGDVTGAATFTNLGNATLTATVADDSHDHTALPRFIEGAGATGAWTGTHPDIEAYTDGMVVWYKINFNGASTTTLNINGLGAKTIYRNGTSKLTTHWPVNSVIPLVYSATLNGGCFLGGYGYDSNQTYDLRWSSAVVNGTSIIHGYQLLMEGADTKFYPVTVGGVANSTTNTVQTAPLRIGGQMLYYSSSSDIAANAAITNNLLYESIETAEGEYWMNRTNSSSWTAIGLPLYIVGTVNANNELILDNSTTTAFLTNALPTTEDGKVYIHVGYSDNEDDLWRLSVTHPIFEFKAGAIRRYTPALIPSEVLDAVKTVDGSGSGLDADLLDGMNATDSRDGNTIVMRQANGYMQAVYVNTTDDASSTSLGWLYGQRSNSDGYHRRFNAASIRDWGGFFTTANDGSGSGLDADLLDGQQGSYYAPNSSLGNYLPLTGGTLTGDTVITSAGTSNSPMLRLNATNTTTFVHGQETFASGLTSGQHIINVFGKEGNTKNAGYIGYLYSGTLASNNNKLTLGHWGSDDLVTIDGLGNTSINGGALQISGTTVIDSSRNLNTSGSFTTASAAHSFITPYGYISLGPQNSSWGHIYTDRPNFYFNKELYVNNSRVWHAGNDGSGSGLDADLLDGLDSTAFMRHGLTYTPSAVTRFQSNDVIDTGAGSQASLEVYQDTAGEDAFMAFHVSGDYAAYFGLHGGINDFVVGGWSKGAGYQRVFHDGYHPNADTWTTARTLGVTLTGDVTGSATMSVNGGSNQTATITTVVADDSHNHSNYLPISGKAADSDLLDGINSTGFVRQLDDSSTGPDYLDPSSRRVNPNASNPTNEHYAVSTFGNFGNVSGQLATHFVSGAAYTRGYNTAWSAWRTQWDSLNDGAGSGLDADLLDGQQGSYYAPASHNHSGVYLPIGGKAADSELLDGINSTSFLRSDAADSGGTTTGSSLNIPYLKTNMLLVGATNFADTINGAPWYGLGTSTLVGYNNSTQTMSQLANYWGLRLQTQGARIDMTPTGYAGNILFGSGTDVSGTTWARINSTGLYQGLSNLVWNSGNDGSGSGLDADLLDGIDSGSFLRSDTADTFTGTLTMGTQQALVANNYGRGVFGIYSATRYQHVWSMGTAYKTSDDGTSYGNMYGLTWTHTNVGTGANQSIAGLGHQLQLRMNGTLYAAIGSGIWTLNTITSGAQGTLWGSSNDGSGSGLDADLLDGAHKVDIQKELVNVTSPAVTAADSCLPSTGYGFKHFLGLGPSNNDGHILGMTWTNTASYGAQIFVDTDPTNTMAFRSRSSTGDWTSWNTVWHTGNDGSGSGLDADLLDGQQGSYYAPASHSHSYLPLTGGTLSGNLITSGSGNYVLIGGAAANNAYDTVPATTGLMFGGANDPNNYSIGTSTQNVGGNYTKLNIKWHTGLRFFSMPQYGGARFYSDAAMNTETFSINYLDGHVRAANNLYANGGYLVFNASNDGSGSGLDADLLDGYNSDNFLGKFGSGYYQANNWTQLTGGNGLYCPQVNDAHFTPNATGSYGTWRIVGSRSGYTGIYLDHGAVNTAMYDSGGNGGEYSASFGWYTYFHRGNGCMGIAGSSTSASYGLYEQGGGIYSTGNITAYSDRRVKENIRTIDNALETVEQMRGVYYNRIDDEEKKTVIGFIAQEVDEVEGAKPLVTYAADVDQYGVSYGNATALLVEAIKQLSQQVKDLQKEIKELKND